VANYRWRSLCHSSSIQRGEGEALDVKRRIMDRRRRRRRRRRGRKRREEEEEREGREEKRERTIQKEE